MHISSSKKKIIGITTALILTSGVVYSVTNSDLVQAIQALDQTPTLKGQLSAQRQQQKEQQKNQTTSKKQNTSEQTGLILTKEDSMRVHGEIEPLISLCFHEVLDSPKDPLAITPAHFRALIREIKSKGYTFVDANDLVKIKNGEMKQPQRAIMLGFDDGYKDNYLNAYPILREEGAKATFFLISGEISHKNRMTYADIEEMIRGGMAIGSHTVSHRKLSTLPDEEAFREMNDSKFALEHDFGVPVNSIAYPGGYENQSVLKMAHKMYDVGFVASDNAQTPNEAMTVHRYAVFKWNTTLDSILANPQPAE